MIPELQVCKGPRHCEQRRALPSMRRRLTVWTKQGPVAGVVSRRAPHLLTGEDRNKVPQFTDIWLDIAVKDRKEAEELITLGDPVTLALGLTFAIWGIIVLCDRDVKASFQ